MTARRIVAFLLIVVQCLLLALMSRNIAFAAVLAVAAALGGSGVFAISITRQRHLAIVLGIIVLFALKLQFLPLTRVGTWQFRLADIGLNYSLAHGVAQGLLAYQTFLLFVKGKAAVPEYYPFLAAATAILVANIPITMAANVQVDAFSVLSVVLAVLVASYFALSRPSPPRPTLKGRGWARFAASIFLITLAGSAALVSSHLLYVQRQRVDNALVWLVSKVREPSVGGYSGGGRLGSVAEAKSRASNRVALRIRSDVMPGYLRGTAFRSYIGRNWEALLLQNQLRPSSVPKWAPQPSAGLRAFAVNSELDGEAHGCTRISVDPADRNRDVVFCPAGTAYVYADTVRLCADDDRSVRRTDQDYRAPYDLVAVREDDIALTWENRAQLLVVPLVIQQGLQPVADRIFAGCKSDAERIEAVRQFFEGWRYHIGIKVPEDIDPVVYFVVNRKAAHCEYYASATALLLRMGGTPTRYVTGFLAASKNALGDYWVARNKDAHAWVEAYDSERGWVTVDTTPAEGVPQDDGSRLAAFADFLKWMLSRALLALKIRGIGGCGLACLAFLLELGRSLLGYVQGVAGLVLLAGLAALALMRVIRRRKGTRSDPRLAKCQRLLKRVDASVRKKGLERRPSETLHQFAARLSDDMLSYADWYRAYADLRYGGRMSVEALAELAAAVPPGRP